MTQALLDLSGVVLAFSCAAPLRAASRLSLERFREFFDGRQAGEGPASVRGPFTEGLAAGAAQLGLVFWFWLFFPNLLKAFSIIWRPHSNYHGLCPADGADLLRELANLVPGVLWEEVAFRSFGLGCALRLVPSLLGSRALSKVLFAALNAALFTAAHETGDGVLMLCRFLTGLLLARAYYRAGLIGAVACHATFDYLVVGLAFFGPRHRGMFFFSAVGLACWAAARGWACLRPFLGPMSSQDWRPAVLGRRRREMSLLLEGLS